MSDRESTDLTDPLSSRATDLIADFHARHEAWRRQGQDLERLRADARVAAGREAETILANARADIHRTVVDARRALLVLTAQLQAINEGAGVRAEHDAEEQVPDSVLQARRDLQKLLADLRPELDEVAAQVEQFTNAADGEQQPAAATIARPGEIDRDAIFSNLAAQTIDRDVDLSGFEFLAEDRDPILAALAAPAFDRNPVPSGLAAQPVDRDPILAALEAPEIDHDAFLSAMGAPPAIERPPVEAAPDGFRPPAKLVEYKPPASQQGKPGVLAVILVIGALGIGGGGWWMYGGWTSADDMKPPMAFIPRAPKAKAAWLDEQVPTLTASLISLPSSSAADQPTSGTSGAAASAETLSLDLEVRRPTWVQSSVDSGLPTSRTFQPGETLRLQGVHGISIMVRDAGAVLVSVNGRPRVSFGPDGQVVTRHFAVGDGDAAAQ